MDKCSLDIRKTCYCLAYAALCGSKRRTFKLSLQSFSHIMCCLQLLVLAHDNVNLDVVLVASMVCSCLFIVSRRKCTGIAVLTVSIFKIFGSWVTDTYTSLFKNSFGADLPTKYHICSKAVEPHEKRIKHAMQMAPAGSKNHTFANLVPTMDMIKPKTLTTMSFRWSCCDGD